VIAGQRVGAWIAKFNSRSVPPGTIQSVYTQWIQVDFFKPTMLKSVTTKGRFDQNEYVTEYSIQYSFTKELTFENLRKPGSTSMIVSELS